jgi:hypothetical protein
MQSVTFKENARLENVVKNPGLGKTTLTEWLHNNTVDSDGAHLRYIDYLTEYRWDTGSKSWIKRSYNRTPAIGRLIYVHPASGELFYLRMLLFHQRGCKSFEDIRTTGDTIHPTFRAACEHLGLLGDDDEWYDAFSEAATWASPAELRNLFAHMLIFCDVTNPLNFWNKHWRSMGDDITHDIRSVLGITATPVNDEDLQQYILYELQLLLSTSATTHSLSDFGLPKPCKALMSYLKNRLILEERSYNISELRRASCDMLVVLNTEQKLIYEKVINSCNANQQLLLFIYGYGGTGKTFLWTTITAALRS